MTIRSSDDKKEVNIDRADSESFSVIVPVFNERESLGPLASELTKELFEAGMEMEVIIVDDGSTDGSQLFEPEHSRIQVVRHSINRGYGAALKTGIRYARFERIAITDADGTYPVDKIRHLVQQLKHSDMVVGARNGENANYPAVRMLPKAILKVFCEWIVQQKIPDLNSGMRAFKKPIVNRFAHLLPNGFSFTTTLTVAMISRGYQVEFESIGYTRRVGKSKFKPIRDTLSFATTLLRLGVYFAPLRVFVPISAAFAIAGSCTLLGDIFIRQDITDRTVILILAAIHTFILALLADAVSRFAVFVMPSDDQN